MVMVNLSPSQTWNCCFSCLLINMTKSTSYTYINVHVKRPLKQLLSLYSNNSDSAERILYQCAACRAHTSFVLVRLLAMLVKLGSSQLKIITSLYVCMLQLSGRDRDACLPQALKTWLLYAYVKERNSNML